MDTFFIKNIPTENWILGSRIPAIGKQFSRFSSKLGSEQEKMHCSKHVVLPALRKLDFQDTSKNIFSTGMPCLDHPNLGKYLQNSYFDTS